MERSNISWWQRWLLIAIVCATVLAGRQGVVPALLWSIVIGGALSGGVGAKRSARRQRAEAALVATSAGAWSETDGERVAVEGTLDPVQEVLYSPIRKKPCVAYRYNGYHFKSRGSVSRTPTEVYDYGGVGMVPVVVRRESRAVRLGAYPELIGFSAANKIDVADGLEPAKSFFDGLEFDELGEGNILPWTQFLQGDWDGTTTLTRNYRQGDGFPLEKVQFEEEIVSPGVDVCAVGFWSSERGALVGGVEKGREVALRVYSGRARQVETMLAGSAKSTTVLGLTLTAAALVLLGWLLWP